MVNLRTSKIIMVWTQLTLKKYRFNNAKDPENRTYYIKFAHDKNSLLHMEITVKRLLKKTNKIDIFIRYHSIFLATLKLERHESSCAVQ